MRGSQAFTFKKNNIIIPTSTSLGLKAVLFFNNESCLKHGSDIMPLQGQFIPHSNFDFICFTWRDILIILLLLIDDGFSAI